MALCRPGLAVCFDFEFGFCFFFRVELQPTEPGPREEASETAARFPCGGAHVGGTILEQPLYLASMSHELRTPMNAIMGMTDLALAQDLPASAREFLQISKESSSQLLELLNEILDFSRIEAGRLEMESIRFSLIQTVEQVVKTLGARSYEKGLELICEMEDNLPPCVVGDPLRLRQVLVAEDTAANQKLVSHLLGQRGHLVTIAQNGAQAVAFLKEQPFDIVLMDVQMPELDGFQATAAIHQLVDPGKANIPIIALTAHALKGDEEKCLAAGMKSYLSKPLHAQELIQQVERIAEARDGSKISQDQNSNGRNSHSARSQVDLPDDHPWK